MCYSQSCLQRLVVPPASINTITSKHQPNSIVTWCSSLMLFSQYPFLSRLFAEAHSISILLSIRAAASEWRLGTEKRFVIIDGDQLKLRKPFCHCIMRTSPNNSHPKQNSEGKTAVFRHIHLGHFIISIIVSLPIWMKFLDILLTYSIPLTQQINHLLSLVVTICNTI